MSFRKLIRSCRVVGDIVFSLPVPGERPSKRNDKTYHCPCEFAGDHGDVENRGATPPPLASTIPPPEAGLTPPPLEAAAPPALPPFGAVRCADGGVCAASNAVCGGTLLGGIKCCQPGQTCYTLDSRVAICYSQPISGNPNMKAENEILTCIP